MTKLEMFEQAFRAGTSSCTTECACGKVFYDAFNNYDWEEGELEQLESSSAIGLPYSVSSVTIEGADYVRDCDCWHSKAGDVMLFIDRNAPAIVAFLRLEREEQRRVFESAINPPANLVYQSGPNAWHAIISAPKGETVEVMLADEKTIVEAHWASDPSGAEQPPFEGWFVKSGKNCYCGIDDPIRWRRINMDTHEKGVK